MLTNEDPWGSMLRNKACPMVHCCNHGSTVLLLHLCLSRSRLNAGNLDNRNDMLET